MRPFIKWHKITSLSPKILADERGYILGLVMIFFIVFSIIGLSILKMAGLERLKSLNFSQKEKAFYHAAGGIHKGLWLANKVSNAAATFSDSTVSVVYDSVNLILTATGYAGNMQDSIRVTLKQWTDVLFVVKISAPLSQDESDMKALMESWGCTVALISEGDSQANFDAAVDTSDVAYVGHELGAGPLSTKLRDAAVGVVNTKRAFVDEFGFSEDVGTYTATAVDITDNSHYITSLFSAGLLAITTHPRTFQVMSGTLAPDLQVIAEKLSATDGTLAVIDVGGAFWDTGTAAGRRVQLPWGNNSFDFDLLNDDGKTLVKRSLEWASGFEGPAGTLIIKSWTEL